MVIWAEVALSAFGSRTTALEYQSSGGTRRFGFSNAFIRPDNIQGPAWVSRWRQKQLNA